MNRTNNHLSPFTFHLKSLNINKERKKPHDIWHWKIRSWLGTDTTMCQCILKYTDVLFFMCRHAQKIVRTLAKCVCLDTFIILMGFVKLNWYKVIKKKNHTWIYIRVRIYIYISCIDFYTIYIRVCIYIYISYIYCQQLPRLHLIG